MAKVNRVGRAFSTLPFDGIDNVRNVFLHDDFINVAAVSDIGADTAVHSQLTWVADETNVGTGPGTIAQVAGGAGHPGVIALQTDDEADAVMSLTLGGGLAAEVTGGITLDDNGVYVASIVRIPDVDATNVEFGLIGGAAAAPNSASDNIVVFAYEEADTAGKFLAQINDAAGNDVEEAFTLSYVEDDWALLELYATDEDAYFRLTTEDGSETIHLAPAGMPLVDLKPVFTVESVGAAVEQLDIDAFHLRYSRDATPANAGPDFLGA